MLIVDNDEAVVSKFHQGVRRSEVELKLHHHIGVNSDEFFYQDIDRARRVPLCEHTDPPPPVPIHSVHTKAPDLLLLPAVSRIRKRIRPHHR